MSVVWQQKPGFPAEDLNPDTRRYKIGQVWVDWDEPNEPTPQLLAERFPDLDPALFSS
jgi:hypothetical protein